MRPDEISGEKDTVYISNIDVNSVAPCKYATRAAFFDLSDIIHGGDNAEKQVISGIKFNSDTQNIDFNFCESPLDPVGNCTNDNAYAFISSDTTGTCADLRANEDQKADTFGIEMRDDEGVVNGVSLNFYGGADTCEADPTQNYWLTVNITCTKDEGTVKFVSMTDDLCHPTINYLSNKGCPVFTFDALTQFLDDYYYLWGAALIIIGLGLAFWGNKAVNVVIFLVTTLVVFVILGSIFFKLFMDKVKEDWAKWLSVAVIVAIGAGAGYMLAKYRKYGVGLLAGWGGVMIGFVITSSFAVGNQYAFYAILAVSAVVMFYLAVKLEETVIILVTSFIGAYATVRGVSLYVGGFPSETELHVEISSGAVDWETYDKKFYIYLGAILVMTCISALYQRRQAKNLNASLHGGKEYKKMRR